LNSRTENTTPNERPSEERIKREERQRSHFSFNNASETGFPGLAGETGGGAIDVSGIFSSSY